jgi:AP-1 complex subunit gamma-1
MVTN